MRKLTPPSSFCDISAHFLADFRPFKCTNSPIHEPVKACLNHVLVIKNSSSHLQKHVERRFIVGTIASFTCHTGRM